MSCFESEMSPKGSYLEHSSQLVALCWRTVKPFRGGASKVPGGRFLKGLAQATLSAAIGTATISHFWHQSQTAMADCGRLRSSGKVS